jgi:hypothetical protein
MASQKPAQGGRLLQAQVLWHKELALSADDAGSSPLHHALPLLLENPV